jgi:enoyl-CoA hydratase/carnithine racemase
MSLVRVEEQGGVSVVTLDRPGANAFDEELVADLRQAFREAVGSPAVVLASALPSIFSAGWDLKILLRFQRKAMEGFLEAYCDLVREIFVFGAPVVAALSGHAIAGGLIVAAAADERIAADGRGQLGLSEVLLGVPVPHCLLELFRHVVGARGMERLASTGENLSVEQALTAGLVDRVVLPEDLLQRAVERAALLAKLPASAHAAIKRRARAAALARFDQARERDPFLDVWFTPGAQERIAALVAKLSTRR